MPDKNMRPAQEQGNASRANLHPETVVLPAGIPSVPIYKTGFEEDARLWQMFRGGDEGAYNRLMVLYMKLMFNYGFRIAADRDFVKDCVQDVFLELWKRRERISQTPSVKSYLFKALRLRIYREQHRWNRNEIFSEELPFDVDFGIENRMIREQETRLRNAYIKNILNGLPARQKEIIYLRFFENLDFEKIGQIMEISRQSVYNLLQKSFKSFRAAWQPHMRAV